ncbi:MAG: hypothetical protein ACKVP0_18140 [Pirellulaceae bacterium]
MKTLHVVAAVLCHAIVATALVADDGDTWSKSVKSPAERGSLEVRAESVRGDTGKWRDDALLQAASALPEIPAKFSLDDWADKQLEAKTTLTAGGDTWLVFRTRQFDDNDRAWVEKIERKGNRFNVVMHQAIWKGRYGKSFTYYRVIVVNLGKLPAGDYATTWTVQPLSFTTFEDPKNFQTSTSKGEQPAKEQKGEKLKFDISFKVENIGAQK